MLLLHRGESFNANFYYHSGVDIDNSFLLASGRRKALITNTLNAALARDSFQGKVIVAQQPLDEAAKRLRGAALYDAASMSARLAEKLGRRCRLKDYSAELLSMRARKRPDEVAKIRRAVRETKEIIRSLDFGRAKTESGVRKQLLVAAAERGLEPAFDPIVSSGANTAYPHYRCGNARLRSHVMVDFGVRWGHYCADITRCFILDGNRRKKEEYGKLRSVCHSVIDALPELRTGRAVAAFAAKEMEKAGFPQMIHSIGHGVGLDIHEFPRLGAKYLDATGGAAMAIEPAFYGKRYGMRYEETVHFNGKKATIL